MESISRTGDRSFDDEMREYYDRKRKTTELLQDALRIVTELRELDYPADYTKIETMLQKRLEMARYYGD